MLGRIDTVLAAGEHRDRSGRKACGMRGRVDAAREPGGNGEPGFVVLVHDHRNFGANDGTVRHDIDPWRQIADWRRAISFLEAQSQGFSKRRSRRPA